MADSAAFEGHLGRLDYLALWWRLSNKWWLSLPVSLLLVVSMLLEGEDLRLGLAWISLLLLGMPLLVLLLTLEREWQQCGWGKMAGKVTDEGLMLEHEATAALLPWAGLREVRELDDRWLLQTRRGSWLMLKQDWFGSRRGWQEAEQHIRSGWLAYRQALAAHRDDQQVESPRLRGIDALMVRIGAQQRIPGATVGKYCPSCQQEVFASWWDWKLGLPVQCPDCRWRMGRKRLPGPMLFMTLVLYIFAMLLILRPRVAAPLIATFFCLLLPLGVLPQAYVLWWIVALGLGPFLVMGLLVLFHNDRVDKRG